MLLSNSFNMPCACRRSVKQRRNSEASADLASVQELLAAADRQTHSGAYVVSTSTFFT